VAVYRGGPTERGRSQPSDRYAWASLAGRSSPCVRSGAVERAVRERSSHLSSSRSAVRARSWREVEPNRSDRTNPNRAKTSRPQRTEPRSSALIRSPRPHVDRPNPVPGHHERVRYVFTWPGARGERQPKRLGQHRAVNVSAPSMTSR